MPSIWRPARSSAVTVQDADDGDTETSSETLIDAAEQIEAVVPEGDGLQEVVGDKGYHSNQSLVDLEAVGVRSYISEPDRGRRNWKKKPEARAAVYRNRRRIRGARGAAPAAAPRRALGAALRASLRDRRHAPRAPARAHEHSEATADPHRRLQSRAADAAPDRRRHAARPPGAASARSWPRCWRSFGSSRGSVTRSSADRTDGLSPTERLSHREDLPS